MTDFLTFFFDNTFFFLMATTLESFNRTKIFKVKCGIKFFLVLCPFKYIGVEICNVQYDLTRGPSK